MSVGNSPETYYTLCERDGTRTTLSHVTSVRDLGVWMTPQMGFSPQCQNAAAKATQALGVIKRTFKHLNKESFPLAYKSTAG